MNNETLEEAAENYYKMFDNLPVVRYNAFISGAKWQAERMYSEEEVIELLKKKCLRFEKNIASPFRELLLKQDLEWFEQNKKK